MGSRRHARRSAVALIALAALLGLPGLHAAVHERERACAGDAVADGHGRGHGRAHAVRATGRIDAHAGAHGHRHGQAPSDHAPSARLPHVTPRPEHHAPPPAPASAPARHRHPGTPDPADPTGHGRGAAEHGDLALLAPVAPPVTPPPRHATRHVSPTLTPALPAVDVDRAGRALRAPPVGDLRAARRVRARRSARDRGRVPRRRGLRARRRPVGYAARWGDVSLSGQNLLDADVREAQFATVSRLPGEADSTSCPAGTRAAEEDGAFLGCEDLHFTPGAPINVQLALTLMF